MIEHLRGRERALEPLGWTGREAEWIALVCLHSGVFIRPQFCHYFNTDRKQALRVVRALVARRAGIEGDSMMFPGGARLCRISNMAIYRALAPLFSHCCGPSVISLHFPSPISQH